MSEEEAAPRSLRGGRERKRPDYAKLAEGDQIEPPKKRGRPKRNPDDYVQIKPKKVEPVPIAPESQSVAEEPVAVAPAEDGNRSFEIDIKSEVTSWDPATFLDTSPDEREEVTTEHRNLATSNDKKYGAPYLTLPDALKDAASSFCKVMDLDYDNGVGKAVIETITENSPLPHMIQRLRWRVDPYGTNHENYATTTVTVTLIC